MKKINIRYFHSFGFLKKPYLKGEKGFRLYDIWNRQGLLNLTEGNVVHYGFIEKFIEKLGEEYNIREIVYDRWGATQMSQNLEDGFY